VVYEYWVYYAFNDYANDHEHDWERYYLYFYNGVPASTFVSSHNDFYQYDWADWTSRNLIEPGTSHLKLSVAGGSHAFKAPTDGLEDGVRITYSGYINRRNGRLDAGDQGVFTPYVFSNDLAAADVQRYTLQPSLILTPFYYYYGDPYWPWPFNRGEYEDAREAPWDRYEFSYPPPPY